MTNLRIARFDDTDLFLIEVDGVTYTLNTGTERVGISEKPIREDRPGGADRVLLEISTAPIESVTLEHREGEFFHLRHTGGNETVWQHDDDGWVVAYSKEKPSRVGVSNPIKSDVEQWVKEGDVLAHGFLNGKVTTDWKVGDVVPAGTELSQKWLGRATDPATEYHTMRIETFSSYDREILWIEDKA